MIRKFEDFKVKHHGNLHYYYSTYFLSSNYQTDISSNQHIIIRSPV